MSVWIRAFFVLLVPLFLSTAWAEDPSAESVTQPADPVSTEAVPEPVEDAASTADDESYESGEVTGRIEDGRNFVWAAYGLTWAVLSFYGLMVFLRSRKRPEEAP